MKMKQTTKPEMKGEVPDAFRRIRAILEGPTTTDLQLPRVEPYDRYAPKSFETDAKKTKKLRAAKEELREFWGARLDIFEPPYGWTEDQYYAGMVVGRESGGNAGKKWYPGEDAMRLFVLLSDSAPDSNDARERIRTEFAIKKAFEGSSACAGDCRDEYREISPAQIAAMLKLDALRRLIPLLDSGDIAHLLTVCSWRDINFGCGLVDKVALSINKVPRRHDIVRGLVDYVVCHLAGLDIRSAFGCELVLALQGGGTEARRLAKDIMACLEDRAKDLQRALNFLKGEQHE